ncbi:hypothetical protein [Vulgatibacter sp.]|uniref:hypothetical protein n=1 Tax=Vulgatibacter sp. TaxID=1971226 RepID=UPI003568282B
MGIHTPLLAAALATALLPAAAHAQLGEQPDYQREVAAGSIKGIVQSVDAGGGTVTLRAGGRTFRFRGTPTAIQQFAQGEVVELQYENHAGQLWLRDRGEQAAAPAPEGRLSGTVSEVDRSNGSITVRGQHFRAHPEELQAIQPGQSVRLSWAQVEATPWALQIQPGQARDEEQAPWER